MDGATPGRTETFVDGAKAAAEASRDGTQHGIGLGSAISGGTVDEYCAASWTAVDAAVMGLRSDTEFELSLGSDRHQLLLLLEVIGGRFAVTADFSPVPPPRASHVLSLVPRCAAVRGCGRGVQFLRLLALAFDEGAVERMIDGPGPSAQRLMFADARLRQFGIRLAQECVSDTPTSRSYVDALSFALIRRMADLSDAHPPPERGGLPPLKLRRVTEYMREHLADDFGMRELAGLVGMSVSCFSQAFKNSTRLSPHQWLILARCERAKSLRMEGRLRLAEVALEVGCYDQAHFTRLFAKHVGLSPGSWRRFTVTPPAGDRSARSSACGRATLLLSAAVLPSRRDSPASRSVVSFLLWKWPPQAKGTPPCVQSLPDVERPTGAAAT